MSASQHNEAVRVELRRTDSLSATELDQIWAITDRYVDTDRAIYEQKLFAVSEVGLWRVRGGGLIGLVALDTYSVEWNGRQRSIIFTSSVVLDERYRHTNLILRTGLFATLRARLRHPLRPTYWLFDTFSYKSYALLAHNFTEFWPRRDRPMPASVAAFMDVLARQRYGAAWDSSRGVVARSGHKRLRPTTAPIDNRVLADPDVQFFDRANPGHREGDMLVCIAPISVRNVVGAAVRGLRHRRPAPTLEAR